MPSAADREKALETALAQIDRQFGKGKNGDIEESRYNNFIFLSNQEKTK